MTNTEFFDRLFSFRNFRIATFLYAALILSVSSIPAKSLPSEPIFNDKVIHFTEYFVFGTLIFLGFFRQKKEMGQVAPSKERLPSGDLHPDKRARSWIEPKSLLTALLFAAGFALLDETVQSFTPGRDPDFFDGLADFNGFFCALALFHLLRYCDKLPRFFK